MERLTAMLGHGYDVHQLYIDSVGYDRLIVKAITEPSVENRGSRSS